MVNKHKEFAESMRNIMRNDEKNRKENNQRMVGIFFADDWQQRRFAALRYGYYSMGQRQYEEAIDLFEQYLNVESDIYWYLMELVNGESYSCKNVSDCLAECRVLKEKIYHEGV